MGMVTLSIVPSLASVATLTLGVYTVEIGVLISGAIGVALCVSLIVIAQLGPGPRTAALIVMGVLSMLIIIGVGLVLAVIAVIYVGCAKMMGP